MLFALLLGIGSFVSSASACCGSAEYEVKFQGTWSALSHPTDYPTGSAHWSGLVGATHNADYNMWRPGGFASPGVKAVAEFGAQSTLANEMRSAGDDVFKTLRWFGIGSGTGSRAGRIQVDTCHRLISLITMIAPSPDWFVGVHNLNLCDGANWINSTSIDVFPYDAGTDSGPKFRSLNQPTRPAEAIHRLTGTNPNDPLSSFFGYKPVPKMATFTFTRLSNPTLSECCCASGSPVYVINFEAAWSRFRHPDVFVKESRWSKIVGASHSGDYEMWSPDAVAMAGVRNVATMGSPAALLSELSGAGDAVLSSVRGNNVPSGIGQVVLRLNTDASHPFLSAITMAGPSPDWFTGIHDVNVCPDGNRWIDGPIEIPAWLYDAGVDSGVELTSPDNATNPQEPVFRVNATKSFGKFVVLRKSSNSTRYLKKSRVQQRRLNDCVKMVEEHVNEGARRSARDVDLAIVSDLRNQIKTLTAHNEKLQRYLKEEICPEGKRHEIV